MKKNITKIAVLALLVLTLTGCGQKDYLMDKKDKVITYEKTGQTLPNNILCKPIDKELYKVYEKNNDQLKVPMDKLPTCSNFKVSFKNSGSLWEGLFIRPLAYLIIKLGEIVNNYGISVILIGLAIRLLLLPVSIKNQAQAENMKKINPELQKLEKKYANQTSNEAMMAKSQEMMMLYKKYNVSPFSSCLISFIQLPLFLAFLQAINRIPVVFEDSLFGMYLGMTPYTGLKSGNYIYIILIVLIFLTTYLSFKKTLSSTGNPEQDQSMKTMFYMMLIMIVFTSFSLSTAISLYWIATNGFIVIQNYIIKKIIEKKEENNDNRSRKQKKISIKEKSERRR